jgi:hypothetical protein
MVSSYFFKTRIDSLIFKFITKIYIKILIAWLWFMINIKRLLIKHFNIMYIFILFIIITVLSGIISLYTTYEYNSYISQFIESLETAKNIQIELQKQFNNGKIIILEGISFNTYQHKIHEYSYNAQNIQNQLFNLMLMCKDMKGIHAKIINFTKLYKQVNNEFLSLYSEL